MKTKSTQLGKRAMSILLVLIMVVGLLPAISLPIFAADDSGSGDDGMLVLTLTAINGEGTPGKGTVGSITASALLSNKDDGSYVESKTIRNVEVKISFHKGKTDEARPRQSP